MGKGSGGSGFLGVALIALIAAVLVHVAYLHMPSDLRISFDSDRSPMFQIETDAE
jgi:hypothetical protein